MNDTYFSEETEDIAPPRRLWVRVCVILLALTVGATAAVPTFGCLVSGLPFHAATRCPVARPPR